MRRSAVETDLPRRPVGTHRTVIRVAESPDVGIYGATMGAADALRSPSSAGGVHLLQTLNTSSNNRKAQDVTRSLFVRENAPCTPSCPVLVAERTLRVSSPSRQLPLPAAPSGREAVLPSRHQGKKPLSTCHQDFSCKRPS